MVNLVAKYLEQYYGDSLNVPLRETEEDNEIQVGCTPGEVRTVVPNERKARTLSLLSVF